MSDYNKFLERSRKRRERVAKLLAQGLKADDVAKRMGVSRQRIVQIAKACRTAA
jgi:transposase